MKKIIILIMSVFASLILFNSCGSKEMSQTDTGEIPEWYTNPPTSSDYIYAARTATSRDLQVAVDKATTDARTEIGRIVETKVAGLQKNFNEEVGVGENSQLLQQFTEAQKTVVSTALNGSQIKENKTLKDGENWRAYVLVEYPIGMANAAFLQQLKKQEELYTRYRSSETFKELEKEVEKYEAWKENQK